MNSTSKTYLFATAILAEFFGYDQEASKLVTLANGPKVHRQRIQLWVFPFFVYFAVCLYLFVFQKIGRDPL